MIRNYCGGDLTLPGDRSQIIRESLNPELRALIGKTLITTDGTTLLGADDKAGLAVITEMAAWLQEHPEIPHGPIRVLFTCDEEIGNGVRHVDLARLGGTVAYTLDGGGAGDIDVETFSADMATSKKPRPSSVVSHACCWRSPGTATSPSRAWTRLLVSSTRNTRRV